LIILLFSIFIRGEKLSMQTLNISAMKLIFPMKFIDGFHKVYGSFGEYSTLISKSGYPAINGQSCYDDMSGGMR